MFVVQLIISYPRNNNHSLLVYIVCTANYLTIILMLLLYIIVMQHEESKMFKIRQSFLTEILFETDYYTFYDLIFVVK